MPTPSHKSQDALLRSTGSPQSDTDSNAYQQGLRLATKLEIIDVLYPPMIRVAILNPIIAFVIGMWLFDGAPMTELTVWFCAISAISVVRVAVFFSYRKAKPIVNPDVWLHASAVLAAVTSIIYGIGLARFVSFDQAEYVISVGMAIVCLSSGALVAYSSSAQTALSFFLPLLLIPSYFIVQADGQVSYTTSCVLVFYSIVMFGLLARMNRVFKRLVLVNYQHKQEIEKRKLIEKQLQDISRRDGLTGLFNRRYFDEMLSVEIGRAHRNHSPLCLILFDIDCFKEYNDHYGHVAGDQCLVTIADIASSLANRQGDLLARYGGEEFAIILPNIDVNGATALAQKLQKTVQIQGLPHDTSRLTTLKRVTVSVGVTNLVPFTTCKPVELVKQADEALYEAKRQGRNRVFVKENNGLGHSESF